MQQQLQCYLSPTVVMRAAADAFAGMQPRYVIFISSGKLYLIKLQRAKKTDGVGAMYLITLQRAKTAWCKASDWLAILSSMQRARALNRSCVIMLNGHTLRNECGWAARRTPQPSLPTQCLQRCQRGSRTRLRSQCWGWLVCTQHSNRDQTWHAARSWHHHPLVEMTGST